MNEGTKATLFQSYLVCHRCKARLGLVEIKTVKFRRPQPFEPDTERMEMVAAQQRDAARRQCEDEPAPPINQTEGM